MPQESAINPRDESGDSAASPPTESVDGLSSGSDFRRSMLPVGAEPTRSPMADQPTDDVVVPALLVDEGDRFRPAPFGPSPLTAALPLSVSGLAGEVVGDLSKADADAGGPTTDAPEGDLLEAASSGNLPVYHAGLSRHLRGRQTDRSSSPQAATPEGSPGRSEVATESAQADRFGSVHAAATDNASGSAERVAATFPMSLVDASSVSDDGESDAEGDDATKSDRFSGRAGVLAGGAGPMPDPQVEPDAAATADDVPPGPPSSAPVTPTLVGAAFVPPAGAAESAATPHGVGEPALSDVAEPRLQVVDQSPTTPASVGDRTTALGTDSESDTEPDSKAESESADSSASRMLPLPPGAFSSEDSNESNPAINSSMLNLKGMAPPRRPLPPQARENALFWSGLPELTRRHLDEWGDAFGLRLLHAQRVSDLYRKEQATYRLRTADGDLAMKVYRVDDRRMRRLERIYEMMDQCRRAHFPCPQPLRAELLGGSGLLVRQGEIAVGVYDWLGGENLLHSDVTTVINMTPEQATSAGSLLSRWHRLVGQLMPVTVRWSVEQFIGELRQRLLGWTGQIAPYRHHVDRIVHRLETDMAWFSHVGPIPPLALQWTHGDATVRNFMFEGDEATALIDFDLASVSPRLFDLIILLQAQPEFMPQILRGYRAVWDLSREERKSLPILAGARLLQRLVERLPANLSDDTNRKTLIRLYNAYRQVKLQLRSMTSSL